MPIDKVISEKRRLQCAKLVDLSKGVVREAFDRFRHEELAIAWTGGKDSTLTLWIIKQVCEERGVGLPKTMLIGEGDEFEEIHEFAPLTTRDFSSPG